MTNEEKKQLIKTVIGYRSDIERTAKALADIKEQIDDELRGMPEYDEWARLNEQVAAAKKRLTVALLGNAEYNDLAEQRANLLADKRDQEDILSNYVVSYAVDTKESQLELNNEGDSLPIILKGKLGKPEKYQTNLFAKRAA